jgi:hypothetical protein
VLALGLLVAGTVGCAFGSVYVYEGGRAATFFYMFGCESRGNMQPCLGEKGLWMFFLMSVILQFSGDPGNGSAKLN